MGAPPREPADETYLFRVSEFTTENYRVPEDPYVWIDPWEPKP